jgi:hypothetical protein
MSLVHITRQRSPLGVVPHSMGTSALASVSRPALRPTQFPTQCLPGVKRGRSVSLITHPSSSAEVKNYEIYFLSLLAPAWR